VSGLLTGMGPEGAALALLLVGHALADFALQTDAMVEGKPAPGPLLAHGAVVLVVQAIAVLPLWTPRTLVLVAGVAVVHVLVDGVKGHLADDEDPSLGWFLGDQTAHLVALLVAWRLLDPVAWQAGPVVEALGGLTFQMWSALATGAVYVAAFAIAGHGGNAVVRAVLPEDPAEDDPDQADELAAGRVIGVLERWIVLALTVAGQWSAIAIVFGAKSIARFRELKRRGFAEYYLVGTLTSVLVAVVLGLAVDLLA